MQSPMVAACIIKYETVVFTLTLFFTKLHLHTGRLQGERGQDSRVGGVH